MRRTTVYGGCHVSFPSTSTAKGPPAPDRRCADDDAPPDADLDGDGRRRHAVAREERQARSLRPARRDAPRTQGLTQEMRGVWRRVRRRASRLQRRRDWRPRDWRALRERGGFPNAGAVHIIYGSATGSTSTGNQFFTQDSPGVPGAAERDDHFGRTLAAVDFDDDGFSDLAVGVPEEDTVEGLVQMLMGSAAGLVVGQVFTFNSLEDRTCGCIFGSALAWGDFDDDGQGDLAIGMKSVRS